ncbi:8477_t:CDS:2 [Racocetra fulgida]|uniref:8477_t:CDS:1 n=1 Tax=Racocetra fulgida TaxID=60492 RepID=A0A9N8WIJ0_9GLOM|nr:8477_t:CDS:2 [Racocetra fulgida]
MNPSSKKKQSSQKLTNAQDDDQEDNQEEEDDQENDQEDDQLQRTVQSIMKIISDEEVEYCLEKDKNGHKKALSMNYAYDLEEPSSIELVEFISDEICRQTLYFHLKSTDQPSLNKDPEILAKLRTFVCQAVKAVLIAKKNSQDTSSAIKKCDEVTLDLKIPTKLGALLDYLIKNFLMKGVFVF